MAWLLGFGCDAAYPRELKVPLASYQIRRMTRDQLTTALHWAAREGWNPGLHDGDVLHGLDSEGFLMGWLGDRPVASISCVRYSNRYAFLGFYIVDPLLRGHGLGKAIWGASLEHARGCVVGLDGVVSQQDNYRSAGFALAWCNVRYQGSTRSAAGSTDARVVPLSDVPFEALAAYDLAFHPEPRTAFLRAWVQMPQSHALGWWQAGTLRGYGVLRACVQGHKLAPLCADTPAIAEALFESLCARVPAAEPVFMDVPDCNAAATELALRQGMAATFPTARMYRGPAPQLALTRLYAITSLEVG
jgi:hypothetical protein